MKSFSIVNLCYMFIVDSIVFICFLIIPETRSKPENSSLFSFLKPFTMYDRQSWKNIKFYGRQKTVLLKTSSGELCALHNFVLLVMLGMYLAVHQMKQIMKR